MAKRSKIDAEISLDETNPLPFKKQKIDMSNNLQYECPVCYENFENKIFQCKEGHLICEECYPKFKHCPTCQSDLSNEIRNRALEEILNVNIFTKCYYYKYGCLSQHNKNNINYLKKHLLTCQYRKFKCPYLACNHLICYKDLINHLNIQHQTIFSVNETNIIKNVYTFNQAIKFPIPMMNNKDCTWPRYVRFKNGVEFFILTRFYNQQITIFLRYIYLPKFIDEYMEYLIQYMVNNDNKQIIHDQSNPDFVDVTNNDATKYSDQSSTRMPIYHNMLVESMGEYSIEILQKINDNSMSTTNENNDDDNNNNDKLKCLKSVLKWPGNLYSIIFPFNLELEQQQLCCIPYNVFKKYWIESNPILASAILRLRFTVRLYDMNFK